MADEYANAAALQVLLSGATTIGGAVIDPADALGGKRSWSRVVSREARRQNALYGIRIVHVAGENETGDGALQAASADTLTWQAPQDSTPGTAVEIANGETKVLASDTADAYLIVERVSADDLEGEETVRVADVYENVISMAIVSNADAVAGDDFHDAVILHNASEMAITSVKVYIGDCDDTWAVAKEALSSDAIQIIADVKTAPAAVSWDSGTTPSTGLDIGTIAAGEHYGVWLKRTIAADSDAEPSRLSEIKWQFVLDGTTYDGRERGRYRITRDSFAVLGLWLGEDAMPATSGAPDETLADDDAAHTLTTTTSAGHTWYHVVRRRNKFGIWEENIDEHVVEVDAGDASVATRPTGPDDVTVSATASGNLRVRATYNPAPDGDARGDAFVVYAEEGGAPDPDADTPIGYQLMRERGAIEILAFNTSVAYLEQTPVHIIPRVRRAAAGTGTASIATDTTQLPASGAGTIETTGSFADWDADGFAERTDVYGNRQEFIYYASRTATVLTVASGGRAQWGSTASAGAATDTVSPVVAIDSENTTAYTATADAVGPLRPRGTPFFGKTDADRMVVPTGPSAVKWWVHEVNNIYLEHDPGDTSFYADTVLVWRILYNGDNPDYCRLYIPSEWALISQVAISDAGTTDPVEVAAWNGAKDLYVTVNGIRRVKIDVDALQISAMAFQYPKDMPVCPESNGVHRRYADTVFTVWDPARADYLGYVQIDSSGIFKRGVALTRTLTQAQIEAL